MKRSFNAGDRVAYTASFVRGVGGSLLSIAKRRGTIMPAESHSASYAERVAIVKWDDEPEEHKMVLSCNLARVGSVAFSDPGAA